MLEVIAGVAGGVLDKIFGDDSAEKQAELQKEFAQNGIRWKVADAKAAGIHPLYALGASTAQYAPVSVGTDFASVGQNLGRSMDAMRTTGEKADAFEKTVQSLTLDKMGLENEILRSQLRTTQAPGTGPGMPGSPTLIPGQRQSSATMQSGGITVEVNPANTPAEKWESQYGEIGGEIGGLANFITDVLKRQTGATGPTQLGANMRREIDRSLTQAVKKILKEKRDPIFNERFWQ